MKAIRLLLVVILGGGLSGLSYAGGPWLLPKKRAFIQGQGILPAYRYSSMLMGVLIKDIQGVNRKTFNSDFGFYAEYGLTDRINLITKIPFKYVSTGELTDQTYFENVLPAGDLFGLGNYELDLKYGLVDKKVKVAVSLNTSWNTISKDIEKGLATGYDASSFGLTAHIGRGEEKHYGFLELGFHKYTNNFSDVLKVKIEHGWNLSERLIFALTLDARHSLHNGSYYNENLAQTGLYPNNQSWAAISAKLNHENANGWGASIAVPLVPIRFESVGFNGTVGLGLYKKI